MIILRTRRRFDDTKIRGIESLRRLNYNEVMSLKGSVTKASNNTTLGKTYVKDLIEKVAFNTGGTAVSTDILDLFTKVFEARGDDPLNGGIWIYSKASEASSAVNYWDWVGGRGFAEIYLSFSGDLTWEQSKLPEEQKAVPRYESLLRYLVNPQTGGMTTIHELMHVAVKGHIKNTTWAFRSDIHYANAAADLADDKNRTYLESADQGSAASAYWGARLNQACGYPSHITHKFTNYVLYKPKEPEVPEVPVQKTPPGDVA